MSYKLSRRSFLRSLGITTLGLGFTTQVIAKLNEVKGVKPIEGSWFEFQHHSIAEGQYWNPTLVDFTANQWDSKIKEMAQSGMRYLILLNTAIHNKAYYPSELLPKHQMGCNDPLEDYVNTSSAEVARLTPKAKTLIAPYGIWMSRDGQFAAHWIYESYNKLYATRLPPAC